jgi:hypothetical protein
MTNTRLLLLLATIVIIWIIWYILFKIIFTSTIENFDDVPKTINFDLLLKNNDVSSHIVEKISGLLSKYFSLYETFVQNDIYYHILSTCLIAEPNKDLFSVFSTSDTKNYITLRKNNDPLIKYVSLKNNIILEKCIVINLNTSRYKDVNLYIDKIIIATSINNIDDINFYYSANTDNIVMDTLNNNNYTQLNYANYLKTQIGTNINVYTITFSNGSSTPLLNNIIINFYPNEFKLYYINIYGLSEYNYEYQQFNQSRSSSDTQFVFSGGSLDVPISTVDYNYNAQNVIDDNLIFDSEILAENFKNIIQYKFPWGMYNGAEFINQGNGKGILKDLFGREYRNAIINDPKNELKNAVPIEDTYYTGYNENGVLVTNAKCSIKYLKGSSSMNIIFPIGSISQKYTICAITKYTGGLCQRIITNKTYQPNLLVGHWANNIKVSHNDGWKGKYPNTPETRANNNWLVSCFKTNGDLNNNNFYNNILYNGEASGFNSDNGLINNIPQDNDPNATNYVLTINGLEPSDFGLSYIIIWDMILTDEEMDIMSKNLIHAVLDNSYKIPTSKANLNIANDGLTSETAAASALDIKIATNSNKNGFYFINIQDDSNKIIKEEIYCLLDSKLNYGFGAGWMLAMKGAANSSSFEFKSDKWTTKKTFNPGAFNVFPKPLNILTDTTTEIKTNIFNYYKFNEILIIYNDPSFANIDGNDYYLRSYYKLQSNYGVSLADFFNPKNNYKDFYYTKTNGGTATLDAFKRDGSIFKYHPNSRMTPLNPKEFNKMLEGPNSFNYRRDKFDQQEPYKAIGLNLEFDTYHGYPHKVRIGAVFNENNDMLTIDASGGIGLNFGYNAGNAYGCCGSFNPPIYSKSYPFLLFVR